MPQNLDAYLSYNRKDRPHIAALNYLLGACGVTTWFDDQDMMPGDMASAGLEEGMASCRTCVVLLGESGLGPWQEWEVRGAVRRQATGGLRVIPVLLPGVQETSMPVQLSGYSRVDLADYADGLCKLFRAIRSEQVPGPRTLGDQSAAADDDFDALLPPGFRADVEKIVDLLIGESLYRRKDVFVRELIQNAFDACQRRASSDYNYRPEVVVTIDGRRGLFEVSDNGEGMSRTLLRRRFAVIGRSIRDEEDVLSRTLRDDDQRLLLIAKFGIGFITALMASRRIVVSTKYGDEPQINFRISGVGIPFEYSRSSECDRDPGAIGTTVRMYIADDFRASGAHRIDLLAAVKRYARHTTQVQVYRNGTNVCLREGWNLDGCTFTRSDKVHRTLEVRLGVSKRGGRVIASQGGFYVTDEPEAILPPYVPDWVVGEVNLWPSTVDLNLARDNIIQNERAAEVRAQLRSAFRQFLLDYAREQMGQAKCDERLVYLMQAYYHAYSAARTREQPLLSRAETTDVLLDTMRFEYGKPPRKRPLRQIVEALKSRGISSAYAYYNSSSYPSLKMVIQLLRARGDFVFEYGYERDVRFHRPSQAVSIYDYTVIGRVLAGQGVTLMAIDKMAPDRIEGISYDTHELPARIREEIRQVKSRSGLSLVRIPGGDLSFRVDDNLCLNASHRAFTDLVGALDRLSPDVLRAYVLGLSQSSVARLGRRSGSA